VSGLQRPVRRTNIEGDARVNR